MFVFKLKWGTHMLIGLPKETKDQEYRVGMTPTAVRELTYSQHQVIVQKNAGEGIGCSDDHYRSVGAEIVASPEEIFDKAELIIKIKEPQPPECEMLHEGQTLFTYLHLAPDRRQTELLLKSGCTAIAYETVTDAQGLLPLLAPMSEVAGRLAVQKGAYYLEKVQGGLGVLLSGVPGVSAANVVVLGGGVVGTNAVCMALGLGAKVTVLDKSLKRLRELSNIFGARLNTVYSTREAVEAYVLKAALVIGAVLIAGGAAPKLVTKEMISKMQKGTVVVDVAIDQGGCFETSHPTTHTDPVYTVDGVIHYCVSNMPGAVPQTSTYALNNATLPFIMALANKGCKPALLSDPHLLNGLNIHQGKLTNKAVSEALNIPFVEPFQALGTV
jgi:alanine dehydrogenase